MIQAEDWYLDPSIGNAAIINHLHNRKYSPRVLPSVRYLTDLVSLGANPTSTRQSSSHRVGSLRSGGDR